MGKQELQVKEEKAPVVEAQSENRELPVGNQELPIAVAAAAANRRSSNSSRGRGGGGAGSRAMDGMSPMNILTGYNKTTTNL